jgi:glycosyltransferase involved in cell wall biosynthesis
MNLLTLSSYDPTQRSHGGEIRLSEIIRFFQSQGHHVISGGLLSSDHYKESRYFLKRPENSLLTRYVENLFLMEDYAVGMEAYHSEAISQELLHRIDCDIDAIFVEQPWMFGLATRIRDGTAKHLPIIYGSANIEYRLKRSILMSYFPEDHVELCTKLIAEMELAAIQKCDGYTAVTEADLSWIRSQRPDSSKISVLAANAGNTSSIQPDESNACRDISGHKKYALYVASGHPPNVKGFYEMLGGHCGSFNGDELLVLAGSVGEGVYHDPKYKEIQTLHRHIKLTGVVRSETLQHLIFCAHQILLPITQGEGSNLKTAEALLSGKPIVATSVSFRGYEAFQHLPQVIIADTPREFKSAIRTNMRKPYTPGATCIPEIYYPLTWSYSLHPLAHLLSILKKQS